MHIYEKLAKYLYYYFDYISVCEVGSYVHIRDTDGDSHPMPLYLVSHSSGISDIIRRTEFRSSARAVHSLTVEQNSQTIKQIN